MARPLEGRDEAHAPRLDQLERRGAEERRMVGRREIPRGEARREHREDSRDEGPQGHEALTRRGAPREAGIVRIQTSHTTSTSSMMSACHRYKWAHAKSSMLHCPR